MADPTGFVSPGQDAYARRGGDSNVSAYVARRNRKRKKKVKDKNKLKDKQDK